MLSLKWCSSPIGLRGKTFLMVWYKITSPRVLEKSHTREVVRHHQRVTSIQLQIQIQLHTKKYILRNKTKNSKEKKLRIHLDYKSHCFHEKHGSTSSNFQYYRSTDSCMHRIVLKWSSLSNFLSRCEVLHEVQRITMHITLCLSFWRS